MIYILQLRDQSYQSYYNFDFALLRKESDYWIRIRPNVPNDTYYSVNAFTGSGVGSHYTDFFIEIN